MSMPSFRAGLIIVVAFTVAAVPSFAIRSHRGPTSGHWRVSSGKKTKSAGKIRGQRQIDSPRATQIQEALIKENYLTGSPSRQWDQQTESAMQKFQADHGWQTKLMPDSRALIKLGLGPVAPPPADHNGSQSLLSGPSISGSNLSGSNLSVSKNGSATGNAMLDSNNISQ